MIRERQARPQNYENKASNLQYNRGFSKLILAGCALALLLPGATGRAAEFYKDKTVTFNVGSQAGTGYDIFARLISQAMPEHIPGKPMVIVRNMPGAGSRTAAGFLYNVAPRDGTVWGMIDQSIPLQQALGEKLQFDNSKFNWIGNPEAGINVVLTWHASGIKTIEDAVRKDVTLGSTGSGSSRQPQIMNALLGTRFKIIPGYPGGTEVNLAMERGEVDGRTNSWASLKAVSSEWLRSGKVNILAQIGLEKAGDLPEPPLVMDLATNGDDHTILKLVSAQGAIGRPMLVPPGVDPELVDMLRSAFDATMKDARFIQDARRAGFELNPMSGAKLQALVADVVSTPAPIASRLAKLLDSDESKP